MSRQMWIRGLITSWLLTVLVAGCGPTPAAKPTPPAQPTATASPAQVAPTEQLMRDLAALRFDKLGNPVLQWDHIRSPRASREKPHQLLVLLVDFPDRKFDRFAGEADQGRKLASFFQHELFDEGYTRANTLSHYYRSMSFGAYHLTGTVLPPLTLTQPRGAYGAPIRPEGGMWRNDADPEGLVEEALGLLAKEHPQLPWDDFDRWDPEDFDGDGVSDEPDGYLDHFVLIFAGGGQASCNRLYKLQQVFNPNAGADVLGSLGTKERECADRLWPHRFMIQRREGRGAKVGGGVNRRGGAPIRDDLWARDYNMQSEYTGVSTFAHEFGHSLGLPDLYARTSTNSTGSWGLMSSNSYSGPQSLSSWSRVQLGWLSPKVVLPPQLEGPAELELHLRRLDDPAGDEGAAPRAALVVLPPRTVTIDLGGLPAAGGKWALYSGQGNQLNRSLELDVDLRPTKGKAVALSFDAWWEIEGGWDFAYVETSTDGGGSWMRRLPTDRRHMPAKHGHDGKTTLPGFTGLSGDLDGDRKNESNSACDPKKELPHGEEAAGADKSPCLAPSWVRPSFDLSDLAGQQARIRIRYFTDMAAVMRGIVVDNLELSAIDLKADFEGQLDSRLQLKGFSKSAGAHQLLVPQYYLLAYRDPYGPKATGEHRYDGAMADRVPRIYHHPKDGKMIAVEARPRPGVVLWYYNGDYAWSENDPAINGPGKGYALVVDGSPNELSLPGFEAWYQGAADSFDTHYDVKADPAQTALKRSYLETVCFARGPAYLPKDLRKLGGPLPPGCGHKAAPAERLTVDGRKLMYSYQVANELLPGPARDARQRIGELVDEKTRKGKTSYRFRDRSLRYLHTFDAPFAIEPFEDGLVFYEVGKTGLKRISARPHPAAPRFDDRQGSRWLNPKLPFGGVAVPQTGFSFELEKPDGSAPRGAQVKVKVNWAK